MKDHTRTQEKREREKKRVKEIGHALEVLKKKLPNGYVKGESIFLVLFAKISKYMISDTRGI